MELEWLGKYRDFVEKLIKFGNSYAQNYKTEHHYNTPVEFSAAQIQTMEYIWANEDKNQNMAEIAARLGMLPGAFSKNVQKMVNKGLLEKFHASNNRKDIIIRVSEQGRRVYEAYTEYAYRSLFERIFGILDQVPEEYIQKFTEVLDISAGATRAEDKPVLIRIE